MNPREWTYCGGVAQMARHIAYSLRTLLAVVTLIGISIGIGKLLGGDLVFISILTLFCVAFGFAFGWSARLGTKHTGVRWPAVTFLGVTWTCWYFNNLSLKFVSDATSRDLTTTLWIMTKAHHAMVFEGIAMMMTVAIGWAAWSRSIRGLFIVGSFSVLLWTVIAWTGYVHASVSLNDLR